jgi:neutral ceramidase
MSESGYPYLVGVADVDVTPAVGSKLAGFAARTEDSTGVYLPLRCIVTAITERATERTLLIVSIEWLGFYDNTPEVRAILTAATGVPGGDILLCGTHTHCGPPIRKFVDADCRGGIDESYLQAAFAKVVTAAQSALADRVPVRLSSSTGWCGIGYSRRRPDGKGGVMWAPTFDAPHDHTVPMLAFHDETEKLKHVLFGYAAHPTAAGAILEFGGDYVGFALRELEQQLGCTAAFLQGCAGDQKPFIPNLAHDNYPKYPLPEIESMGRQVAAAVMRELRQGQWQAVHGNLRIDHRVLTLRYTELTKEDYTPWLTSENEFFARWARESLAGLAAGHNPRATVEFEVQTVCFGSSLAWIALSGEMSVEYALRAVKEFGRDYSHVWPFAYSNDIVGYICSERQLPERGYEVFDSMQYIMKPGPLVSGTEDQIFAAMHELLDVALAKN